MIKDGTKSCLLKTWELEDYVFLCLYVQKFSFVHTPSSLTCNHFWTADYVLEWDVQDYRLQQNISLTQAVIKLAGVTSNAGFQTWGTGKSREILILTNERGNDN